MLQIEQVYKQIDRREILTGVSFAIKPGTITGLIGRNGTGKTTLLRTLIGAYKPDQGRVLWNGMDIHQQAELKQDIVYVPDAPTALEGYKVKQCAALYAQIYPNFNFDYFNEMITRLQLPADRKVRNLSKGMQMLFSTVLGLATGAQVVLLDEPTNGVDAVAKKQLLTLIMESVTPERCILISSHMLHELDRIADSIVLLRDGRTEQQWSLDELRSKVRKLQIVFATAELPAWLVHPSVHILQQTGRIHTVLLESDEWYEALQQEQTLLVDELAVSLEDWFVWKSGGDGDVA